MTIRERLLEDYKAAMKSGDKRRLETIRFLRSQLNDAEINRRGSEKPFTDDDEIAVLWNAVKKRKEAIELFRQGNRTDLVDKEQAELVILQHYLPRELSGEEVESIVQKVVETIGATTPQDMGRVMSAIMKEIKGRVDGKIVQDLVRKKLSPA